MDLTEQHAAGIEYLGMVTDLLQRTVWHCRRWSGSADLQWAWRKDQHPDPAMATFWIDETDRAIGGAVIMDWGESWGADVILHTRGAIAPHDVAGLARRIGTPARPMRVR